MIFFLDLMETCKTKLKLSILQSVFGFIVSMQLLAFATYPEVLLLYFTAVNGKNTEQISTFIGLNT